MARYATRTEVKSVLPTVRPEAIASDSDVDSLIDQSTAWVDSVYPRVAPFADIGNGLFREIAISANAAEEDTVLSIEAEAGRGIISAGSEFMVSSVDLSQISGFEDDYDGGGGILGASSISGSGGSFDRYIPPAPDFGRDYNIYTVKSDVGADDSSVGFSRGLRFPVYEGQFILIGTPPLVRRATIMMANYWAVITGPTINMSDDTKAYFQEIHRILQIKKEGRQANAKPHNKIYYNPNHVRLSNR